MIARIGMTIVAVLLVPTLCFGGTVTETDRINGVVDFLLERGKANYLYIFEEGIKDNREVRCYFPTVYSYVAEGDLRLLLKSRKIWGESVETDLKNLAVRAAAKELGNAVDFKKAALEATDRFLDVAQYVNVKYQGQEYPVTVVPLGAPVELKDLINGFYNGVADLRDALLRIDDKLKIRDALCGTPSITMQDIADSATDLTAALGKLRTWTAHVEKNRGLLTVNIEKLSNDCRRDPGKAFCGAKEKLTEMWITPIVKDMSDKAATVVTMAAGLARYAENIRRADGNTAKALIAVRFLEESKAFDEKVLGRFKNHILFFAELSEAETTEQTKEVLEAYTMPPVSFAVKRERYKNHVLLTAYLGFGYGKVVNAGTYGEDNRKGIYAPVGLEFSRGLGNGASFSLMLAPFDFGYPINLKLNGIKKDIDFNEIVAPSVLVSYGWPKYPISIGAAYQRGRNDLAVNSVEERVLFFIAFDMPLLTFY